MLKHLHVEDYGLIARADVGFADRATIFTGETGSGKTMLVGALAFVMGARADSGSVRSGAQRAFVELTFEPDATLVGRLRDEGVDLDEGEEAALSRELTAAGKSSTRICGRATTAAFVRDIAPAIAEIVGQREAQRLLAPSYHLALLDRFAGAPALELRALVDREYVRACEANEALAAFVEREKNATQALDEARRSLDEIGAANPRLGEDDDLTQRRRFLDNAERIAVALRTAHELLAGEDRSAVGALGAASAAVAGIRAVARELDDIAQRVAALQSEANDLGAATARAVESTEFDAGELEVINARLHVLDGLKRRHGGTIEAVLDRAKAARETVDEIEGRDGRIEELRLAATSAQEEMRSHAEQLGRLRRAAAKRLEEGVRGEFADLALGSGRFSVELRALPNVARNGAEYVEFLFSANAGEELRPLAKIASGGELSRVLLALVVALAHAREQSALVFDEIDAGIGGATAVAVGARIGRLAKSGQLVCITHLAQLATWAQRHYVLEKEERAGATTIGVREIEGTGERTQEIARMLSGETHDVALHHARRLLSQAR